MIKINSVRRLIATAFEIDAGWWDNLSKEKQEQYLKRHPRSKYGKTGVAEPQSKPKVVPSPEVEQPAGKVAKGKAAHKAASVTLDPKEVQALKEYTGVMYQSVNKALRAGKNIPAADRKEMKLVEQAFDKAKTTEPLEVYRGVGATEMDMFKDLKVGESFEDRGYGSTSTDKDTADNFSRGDNPTILKIQVPKGSKAISVDSLSVFKKGGHATRSENEILLNKDAKYKVVDIKPGKRGQPRIITVEYSS